MMKTILFFCSFFYFSLSFAQSDWLNKPYVIINDTSFFQVKHPVFIMDSTLYIRTVDGTVLTFPSRDVNYISKRCFYQRINTSGKNQLSKSGSTLAYLSTASFVIGSSMIWSEISNFFIHPSYYASVTNLVVGAVVFVVPSILMIRNLILRKMRTKMILESKGLKFISTNKPMDILLEGTNP